MGKFNFWDLRIKLDDYFFEMVNWALLWKFRIQKKALKQNIDLKGIHTGKKAFIILNGPSLNEQDIRPLKGEILFFVNRAFKHPDYAYLQPTYHVFVDPKLATGVWSLSFLDEILELNPSVTFLLSSKWYALPQFQPYKQKAKIYWINSDLFFTPFFKRRIDLTKPMPGSAVFGACLNTAIYTGCNPIYFTGFDGNGLAYELINKSSHFYGINDENLRKETNDYVLDLYMMSRNLRVLSFISNYVKKNNIDVINVTKGGLIGMFNRKDLSKL